MLIDGEKWACEACVRGHRVSNCQHSDRPLTHINKKGRPVSQCPHCRGLRKARASHVKCECGEKPHSKEECPELGSPSDLGDNAVEPPLTTTSPDNKTTCCCTHGTRCTCALKKEYLEPVPETGLPRTAMSFATRKPRLQATSSETSLTHFTNGHHKPIHKHNDAHNKCGAPYKIPIPHSISGNHDIARKSSDSLPLAQSLDYAPSPFHDTFTAQHDVRQVRSEHGSPKPRALPRFSGIDSPLPPLDLSYPAYIDTIGSPLQDEYLNDYWQKKPYDSYLTPHDDAPVMSPGLSMPVVDWGALDLAAATSCYSQPPSYASFDHNNVGRPALTTSSSGDVSDGDEFMPRNPMVNPLVSHNEIPHSAPENLYRQDTSSSYLSQPPSEILSSSSPNSQDMDEYVPKTTASPTEFEDPSAPMNAEKFVKHGLTVREVQRLAHPGPPTSEMSELNLPSKAEQRHTPWAHPFDQEDAVFTPEGDERTVWAR
ncbi:MAG: hypothetical protein Q9194_006578 [Teloschistes cf. exilis]